MNILRALSTVTHRGDTLPATVVEREVTVDRDALAAYDRVCGFRLSDVLPPTYPHILSFELQMELMTGADFPFPVMGLLHIANRISQHRPIHATEPLTLSVRAKDLRPHDLGMQFDVVTEAHSDGDLVWQDWSTYLRKSGERASSSSTAQSRQPEPPAPSAVWRIPADIGRRYAAVSGDINPIHMSSLTARVFGFRKAIAHGMWTKARCLAALEARLPDAYTVEVRFKAPILLPATVGFAASPVPAAGVGERVSFSVRDFRTGKPHLEGSVVPGV